jgi:hypothetical protein
MVRWIWMTNLERRGRCLYYRVLGICLKGLRKATKASFRIAGLQTDIQKREFPNNDWFYGVRLHHKTSGWVGWGRKRLRPEVTVSGIEKITNLLNLYKHIRWNIWSILAYNRKISEKLVALRTVKHGNLLLVLKSSFHIISQSYAQMCGYKQRVS